VRRFEESGVGERPDQHDGARDRDRETEHDPLRVGPAPEENDEGGHRGRDDDLADRARYCDPADGPEVVEREVHADAEHEEDHADLCELVRDRGVRTEAGCERADGDSGREVADDRGKPQAGGYEAAEKPAPSAIVIVRIRPCGAIDRGPPALESAAHRRA